MNIDSKSSYPRTIYMEEEVTFWFGEKDW